MVTFAAFATGNIASFADGTATNEAFFTIAGDVGGIWLKVAFSIIVAFVCAVGNIITAQTAVSRVLFSMGRDNMLPRFLAHVHSKRKTPDYAILFTGAVTLILSYLFSGKIESISTLVNFGALFAFFVVNLCVFVLYNVKMKQHRRLFPHIISPVIGMVVIGYVCMNMNIHALTLGAIWTTLGLAILWYRKRTSRISTSILKAKSCWTKTQKMSLSIRTLFCCATPPCSGRHFCDTTVTILWIFFRETAQNAFETPFPFSF